MREAGLDVAHTVGLIAAPLDAPNAAYAGKHTPVGAVIGQCVTEAVGAGIAQWRTGRGV
jgi:adenosylcobinamide amidohydrolase